jgi:hypothetical protein
VARLGGTIPTAARRNNKTSGYLSVADLRWFCVNVNNTTVSLKMTYIKSKHILQGHAVSK